MFKKKFPIFCFVIQKSKKQNLFLLLTISSKVFTYCVKKYLYHHKKLGVDWDYTKIAESVAESWNKLTQTLKIHESKVFWQSFQYAINFMCTCLLYLFYTLLKHLKLLWCWASGTLSHYLLAIQRIFFSIKCCGNTSENAHTQPTIDVAERKFEKSRNVW